MSYDDRATDLDTSPYPLVYPLVRSHETCFLHAAARTPLKTRVTVEVGGR